MKTDVPFWEQDINPITGYRIELWTLFINEEKTEDIDFEYV